MNIFDRNAMNMRPLAERANKVFAPRDIVDPDAAVVEKISNETRGTLTRLATELRAAQKNDRSRMLAFGAHTIKNGLGLVLNRLIENRWLTHLATNGAGIIHDWELAFQSATSEDVRANVAEGRFGTWEETGRHLNLAILLGAHDGLGYGESVGRLITEQRHKVPSLNELENYVERFACRVSLTSNINSLQRAATALDILTKIKQGLLKPAGFDTPPDILLKMREGRVEQGDVVERHLVPHAAPELSVQACAYRNNIPFTGHPMFGHDIIYTHPMSCGAAIGRTAETDFLRFVNGVSQLGDGGVYISVGSAVMSPMIFEKALSMARNRAREEGRAIENFSIYVVDLAPSRWDFTKGEPPMDAPEYYLRYCKTFSRMGGAMTYLSADNRVFFPLLWQMLKTSDDKKPRLQD